MQSHYLFDDRFGRPGKGNDKGKVEGLVGWIRRNYLVPMPRAASFAGLNAKLVDDCRRRLLHAAAGTSKGDDLIPELSRVRVPRSRDNQRRCGGSLLDKRVA